jgi:hypothetical protein
MGCKICARDATREIPERTYQKQVVTRAFATLIARLALSEGLVKLEQTQAVLESSFLIYRLNYRSIFEFRIKATMRRTNLRMKQLVMAMLIWPTSVAADPAPGANVAFKGGANAATLTNDNRVTRYAFSGGLEGYLQKTLTDQFSLGGQLELLYTPRGAKTIVEGDYLGQVRQHYFDIMIAARPGLRLGPASIYLLLGGGLNLLVSANKENALGTKQDITDGLRRIDVALLGGAGVALHLPHREMGPFRLGTVFLEARHDVGLIGTDLMADGFKNRTSSLMLGLSLAVGGSAAPAMTSG